MRFRVVAGVALFSVAAAADRSSENAQLLADSRRFGISCSDVAELQRIASTVSPETAALYKVGIDARREKGLASLKASFGAFGDGWGRAYFAEAENPDGSSSDGVTPSPKQTIATMRARLQAGRCYDEAFASKALALLDQTEGVVDRMIADETKCRATPTCIAPRIATKTCAILDARRSIAADLANEKKNPSGVVDLRLLHALGAQLQAADADAKASKAAYAKAAGKPFSEASCSR